MTTIIENAAKGQRKAMEYLYEKSKRRVFYVAQKLLLDSNQAADAAIFAFSDIWRDISASKIATEEAFEEEAVVKAVDYCRKKSMERDSKAFRIPQNKNFNLSFTECAFDSDKDFEDALLRQLPKLHRFIFVLRTIGRLNSERTAKVFQFKEGIIQLAGEAQKDNIERLICAAGREGDYSYEKFIDALKKGEESAAVLDKVDKQVLAAIDSIAKPMEQKRKKNTLIVGAAALVVCLCILIGVIFAVRSNSKEAPAGEADSLEANTGTEGGELDEALSYFADIEIQDYGMITVELDQKSAPITVENFVKLAESGFYDGLTFHRIIEGFMMQGGDPDGDGFGGSDDTIVGEFAENGYENNLSHTRGAISMARSSDFDSASSQFFIVHEDSDFLDGQYAVFGYVIEGMDVVDAVCESAEPTDSNGTIPAENQPVITSITIWTE